MTHRRKSINRWLTECAKDIVHRAEIARDPMVTDLALERKIRSSLLWNWSTHWVREGIDVEVDEGVACLRGHVDTWVERTEAGRVATNTLGIWNVHNHLRVGEAPQPGTEWATTTTVGATPSTGRS